MQFTGEIEEALARIEQLLAEIEPYRQQCGTMMRNLDEAHREYEEVIGAANRESVRLENAIAYTRWQLSGHAAAERLPEPPPLGQPAAWVTSPQTWDAVPGVTAAEDLRAARKRWIADHVLYFAATDTDPIVVLINNMLTRPEHGPGEMLEVIKWGEIWKAAPDWESEEDRLARLNSWLEELESRLDYWKARTKQLTADYALAAKRTNSTPVEWRAWLAGLAAKQEAENSRRTADLELLQAEWRRRQEGADA